MRSRDRDLSADGGSTQPPHEISGSLSTEYVYKAGGCAKGPSLESPDRKGDDAILVGEMPMLRRLLLALLALVPVTLVTPVPAQTNSQQYVVVYVEFLPAAARQGEQKLDQLAALADNSAGLVSFAVNQQIGRPNFYSLVEIWQDSASYQAFVNATSTQALLAKIQPLLEAPFDERPGTLVE